MGKNLYIHVPFCQRKCHYCAFYSEAVHASEVGEVLLAAYMDGVKKELQLRGVGQDAYATMYFGGGTPSLLGPGGIRRLFRILPPRAAGAEVTMELNPGDVSEALAEALLECGVTRVSLGVQSFCDETLRWMGRRHTAAEAEKAYRLLQGAGFAKISLDFIAALPPPHAAGVADSLRRAVSLGATHLSVYPLSIEENTPFSRAQVQPCNDDEYVREVHRVEALLRVAGYERYEISNYAKGGAECRHNLAVWQGEDYVGVGPAACSREGLKRRANAQDFHAWCEALECGSLPPGEELCYSDEEDEQERFSTAVRLKEFALPQASACSKARYEERLQVLKRLEKSGIACQNSSGSWSLTPQGRDVCDAVAAELCV